MATSGVGMLAQVLGSTLEANRRNAMWQGEQQQQNEMAQAQREAAQQHLAAQLRANLFGQLLADQNKNVAMARSEDRWAQRERERDAAAAAALAKQDAREASRVKAMEREWELRGAEGEKARAAAAELEKLRGENAARAAGTLRRSITERRGDVGRAGGGGQEPDVRKQAEYNRMMAARAALGDAMKLAGAMPTTENRSKVAEAQKMFDEAYSIYNRRYPERGPVAPAAQPVVNNLPSMYLRQPQAPADDDLFTVR